MKDYQLCWRGIIHDATGYARLSREFILALDRIGVDVKVEAVNQGSDAIDIPKEQFDILQRLCQKPLATNKPKVLLSHLQPYGTNAKEMRKLYDAVICYTHCETIPAPLDWAPHLNQYDGLVVSSEHNAQAFSKIARRDLPIVLASAAADWSKYNASTKALDLPLDENDYRFLTVCSFQHRKGIDVLLRAYWSTFRHDEPVVLVLKLFCGGTERQRTTARESLSAFKQKMGGGQLAKVIVSTADFTDEEMHALYPACDCFVLPSRGEGFGIPYLEAAAASLPVIATNWGGHLDFLKPDQFFPVDYTLSRSTSTNSEAIAPVFGDVFTDDTFWAEPSWESLAAQMRHVFDDQEKAAELAGSIQFEPKFLSWNAAAATMKSAIERITERSLNGKGTN